MGTQLKDEASTEYGVCRPVAFHCHQLISSGARCQGFDVACAWGHTILLDSEAGADSQPGSSGPGDRINQLLGRRNGRRELFWWFAA